MTPGDRLFRQDWRSAANLLRASFDGWHDRAIATSFLLVAGMCVRAWFTGQTVSVALTAAATAGLAMGIAVGRGLHGRLIFHASDGILAADALSWHPRRQYLLRWHGAALLLAVLTSLIARPVILLVTVPAYVAGAGIATIAARLPGGRWRGWRPTRSIGPMAGSLPIGMALAAGVLIVLLTLRGIDPMAHRSAAAILGVSAMGVLTRVDDAIVRYLTVIGYGTGRIVARHLRVAAGFAVVLTAGSAVLFDTATAAIIGGCCLVLIALMTLRILAYRLHQRRFADIVVAIVAGLMLATAFTFPVALPVVAAAVLWQMQRRAARRTWLLP